MLRVLALVSAFALLVYALADFANSDERDRGGIPGWLWAVIIILLPYFGPLAWIVFSRSRRRQSAGPGYPSAGRTPRSRRRPSGPIAPDDDPEFLWRLAQEQRNQARPAASGPVTADEAPDDQDHPDPSQQGQAKPGQTGQTGKQGPTHHDQPHDDQGPDPVVP